jgi:signal peptidase I
MSPFRLPRSGPDVIIGIATVALLSALIAIALFVAHGGRGFIVATPSMGTTAPVGTLLLTEPVHLTQLHVGDIISFHPPTAPAETYTHRITAISAGTLSTRGDINGASDPWRLRDGNLIGRATIVLPGIGWLIRGLPILAIGCSIVFGLSRLVTSLQLRSSFRILGVSLVVSFAAYVLKPFTGVQVLQTYVHGRTAGATVVSTGLLPIQVTAVHGTHVALLAGQVGQISIPTFLSDGYYKMASTLHLDGWQWIVFFLVCCLPLIAILIFGIPQKQPLDQGQPT